MVRKKKTIQEQLEDLAELAGELNISGDTFEGDLQDACNDDARLAFENIKGAVLLEQLEFLYLHGYQIGRLRELIEGAVRDE